MKPANLTDLNNEFVWNSNIAVEINNLYSLACTMQNMTEAHMHELGTDYISLKQEGLIWVITCSDIQILRWPDKHEIITALSWPGEDKLGMFSRKYVFYSADGEELISASSAFSLVDGIRRAMVTRQDVDANLPVVRIEGEPAFPKLTKKFPELNRETEHIVSEQEIDKNDHVNNAFYLKWTEDILQKNGIAAGRIAGCWIFYAKELTLGMKVGLMYYLDENQLAVRGMVDGEIYYSAALILKP